MCAATALIHAIVSGNHDLELEDGPLKHYLDKTQDLSPEERGNLLLQDETMISQYSDFALTDDEVSSHHIIAFVKIGDQVF